MSSAKSDGALISNYPGKKFIELLSHGTQMLHHLDDWVNQSTRVTLWLLKWLNHSKLQSYRLNSLELHSLSGSNSLQRLTATPFKSAISSPPAIKSINFNYETRATGSAPTSFIALFRPRAHNFIIAAKLQPIEPSGANWYLREFHTEIKTH